jgi:hypothetical protein
LYRPVKVEVAEVEAELLEPQAPKPPRPELVATTGLLVATTGLPDDPALHVAVIVALEAMEVLNEPWPDVFDADEVGEALDDPKAEDAVTDALECPLPDLLPVDEARVALEEEAEDIVTDALEDPAPHVDG